MNQDAIFDWILSHPLNYPGKHQESQARTNPAYKPLEPKAEFHLILRATAEYIREKMESGKGINMKNFGAFTFEVYSDLVKPAQFSGFEVTKDLNDERADRKHVHKIRPCFVPDAKFKYALLRYPGKEEITAPKSEHSVYEQGFAMIFCNPGPIATSCLIGTAIVQSAHAAFIQAVIDLTTLGHNLFIDFGFVKINVNNRNLKYEYNTSFANSLNEKDFEEKMRKSDTPTSEHWLTSYQDKWNKSTLNSLLKRPNVNEVQDYYEKSLALKIMSLDLSTAEKTQYANTQKKLPTLKKAN